MTAAAPLAERTAPPAEWLALAAEDLRALAWLHAEERSPDVLAALFGNGFPETLTLATPDTPAAQAMYAALRALAGDDCDGTPAEGALPASSADDLAADYAAIYLTHGLRAAPFESVWRDEDHLMLQGPTFAVRDFYKKHGLQVSNWRERADDHLTHELNFVAHLLRGGEEREAARFLAQHLMQWLPDFAKRVAQRAATPVYAALALLTESCCTACQLRLPHVAVIPQVVAAQAPRSAGCSG